MLGCLFFCLCVVVVELVMEQDELVMVIKVGHLETKH
jgi:hypothetical protein